MKSVSSSRATQQTALMVIAVAFAIKVLIDGFISDFSNWDAARLAPIFAAVKGYALYYPASQGPVLNMIYGPFAAWIYWPVTLFSSPVWALIAARWWGGFLILAPVLWICLKEKVSKNERLSRFLLFLTFAAFNCRSYVHADIPALSFGMLACGFLYFHKDEDAWPGLFASAFFAVLSIASKQISFGLLAALPLAAAFLLKPRAFFIYLICFAVAGLAALALLRHTLDLQAFIFNTLNLPAHHPWVGSYYGDAPFISQWSSAARFKVIIAAFSELAALNSLSLAIILSHTLLPLLFKEGEKVSLHSWFSRNRWAVFFLAALFQAPLALISRVKAGGGENAFGFFSYFAGISAVLIASHYLFALGEKNREKACLFLILFLSLTLLPQLTRVSYLGWKNLNKPDLRQASFEYLQKNPGKTYFPWDPLLSLIVEGRLYHFSYGLEDRELAGFPVSEKHFRKHIPSSLEKVIFCEAQDEYIMKYLPEFSHKTQLPELPGCVVYEKNQIGEAQA